LSAAIAGRLASSDPSIWPVRTAMRVMSLCRFVSPSASPRPVHEAFTAAADVLAKDMRSDFEQSAARIDSELLLSLQNSETFHEIGAPGRLIDREILQASTRLAQDLQQRINDPRLLRTRWLRLWQRLVLSLPVFILVIKLAGVERIEAWSAHPSLAGGGTLILGFLTSLFGTDGLVGLLVLVICEFVLILFLAVRRTKEIERNSVRLARTELESLGAGLNSLGRNIRDDWERAFRSIEEALGRLEAIEAGCASVSPEKTS